MANGAGRLFDIIKDTSEGMQSNPSEYVALTVKALNPLVFNKDDRLDIPEQFCVFNELLDTNSLQIGHIVSAIILNNGQLYYILQDLSLNSTILETINQIENIGEYSETEKRIGTWINGKPLYRKVIDFGKLPNSTNKGVAHNIINLGMVTHLYGMAYNSSDTTQAYPLPFTTASNISGSIALASDETYVVIITGINRTNYFAYVVIEYTKNTD